jgi:hypothetical protein
VDEPKLIRQNRFLDFGYGFYTTTNREQAENFAKKVASRNKSGKATLSKAQTLETLKIRKLFNQLVFATDKALGYLKFEGREFV